MLPEQTKLPTGIISRIMSVRDDKVRYSLLEFETYNFFTTFEEDMMVVPDKRNVYGGKDYKHTNQGGRHYRSSLVVDRITTMRLRTAGFVDPRKEEN